MDNSVLHNLRERVKELTLLHKTARLLHDERQSPEELLKEIVESMRIAWQYPEITAVRIRFGDLFQQTDNFRETQWIQSAEFTIRAGDTGIIDVCYLEQKADEDEGPFLAEERELINSVADMLRTYFQHQADDKALKQAYDDLERKVKDRTAELNRINIALRDEIDEHLKARKRIETYQKQLRKMASELSLAEERERRIIASDLHDHIGQALAFIKMKLAEFKGNSMFCGFEGSIDEILTLVNQTIAYTRSLTFEISSPVLYELGLSPAVEWLAEMFCKKHKLETSVRETGRSVDLPLEIKVILFKSVRELLVNIVKHANAESAEVVLNWNLDNLEISVSDNGAGFEFVENETSQGFGLFSVKERITLIGGSLNIDSAPGKGSRITIKAPLENDE